MTRLQVLLSALAAVLLIVLFFFLVFQPRQDELDLIEADIEASLDRQAQLTTERNQLRSVREESTEIEAEIQTAEAIVPFAPEIPAMVRQLQQSADDAGLLLRTVAPARPVQIEFTEQPDVVVPEGLSLFALDVQVEGSFFQIVDFLRRVEDPTLAPRGITWTSMNILRDDETYPVLIATVTGNFYAELPVAPPDEELEAEDEAPDDAEVEAENDPEDVEDEDEDDGEEVDG